MAIKYFKWLLKKHFSFQGTPPPQKNIYSNWDFLVQKYTIWQSCIDLAVRAALSTIAYLREIGAGLRQDEQHVGTLAEVGQLQDLGVQVRDVHALEICGCQSRCSWRAQVLTFQDSHI
jgi:hypothetical protein